MPVGRTVVSLIFSRSGTYRNEMDIGRLSHTLDVQAVSTMYEERATRDTNVCERADVTNESKDV